MSGKSKTLPPGPEATGDVATPARRWTVAFLCGLVCLFDGFDNVLAPIAAPLMAKDWQLAPQAFALALSAAILGAALGAGFIAPLGDRFGRRPLVLISFGAVGLSTLGITWVETTVQFALLRFTTGLGMGASIATALALTAEYATPRLRSRIVATVYAMSALGGAAGGLVAPLLVAAQGWQGIFLFGGIAPLLLLLVLALALPESHGFRIVDRFAAQASILERLASLCAAHLRVRTLLLWLLYFFSMFANYLVLAWLPTLLTLAGWSTTTASHGVSAYALGGVAGGFIFGWIVDRGRTRQALACAFGISLASLAALPLVEPRIVSWLMLVSVLGAGIIGISYALAGAAAAVYPFDLRASGIGAAAAVGRTGAALAPIVGGLLLSLGFSAIQIMTSLIVPLIAALIIVLLFAARLEEPGKTFPVLTPSR